MNTEQLHPKELSALAAVMRIVAAAVLEQRIVAASTVRAAIVGRADAVAVADAVDQALSAGTLDDTQDGAQ